MEATSRPLARQWVLVVVLSLGAFISVVNTTMLSPLLRLIGAEFSVSDGAVGQLATVSAACAGIAALAVAPWMDRFSRGAWLRGECLLLTAGALLAAGASSFAWLFVARVVTGIGGGFVFGICMAAVGDIFTEPQLRNRMVGLVGTAGTLGAILGLPIVTQLGAFAGWRWAMGLLGVATMIVCAGTFWLPRAAPPAERPAGGWTAAYRQVIAQQQTRALLGVMVVLCTAWSGWLIYFAAYADAAVSASAALLTALFFAGGVGELVGNNAAPALIRRHAPHAVVFAALVTLMADLFGVSVVPAGAWALFPFIMIASLCSVVAFTGTSIMLLDSFPTGRGAIMALQSAGYEFGSMAGALIGGLALGGFGAATSAYRALGATLPLALALLVVAARKAHAPAATLDLPVEGMAPTP